MKVERSLFVHLGLLALSALFAVFVWTRDEQPKAVALGDVVVWNGRPADVQRVAYESKTKKKLSLEAKSDELGRYLVGTLEKTSTKPSKPDAGANPHAPPEPEDNAAEEGKVTTQTFVSVGAGQKLLDALAPLKALRAVGRIGEDRAAEFGLAEPEGTIVVTLKGGEKKLIVGGATPGGADRYVKEESSGEVYVLKGDLFRDLDTADQRLVERDLHEWKEADVAKAKVTAGGKTRELVRGANEGKKFWADPSAADKNDESVGNWMSKLDKLRPSEYAAAPPEGREVVVRVDYADAGRPMGYIEVVKVPAAVTEPPGPSAAPSAGKAEYYVVTERTRTYAKVPANLAEQVEQDVGTIVR